MQEEKFKLVPGVIELQKKKRSILIFCDWYEPGYKAGGPIQSCRNIVNSLHNFYSFHIITSDRDLGDLHAYADIPVNQWVNNGNDVQIWYGSPGSITTMRIENLIDQVQPDIIYFNSMFSKAYTLLPLLVLRKRRALAKVVLAPRGMLHAGALQQKAFKKKLFLQLFRWSGITSKINFHATDAQEEKDIRYYFPASNIRLAENIPNVDNHPWQPLKKEAGSLDAVFISRIHPKKNLHFLLELMKDMPPASRFRFDVYGEPDDPLYNARCKELAAALPAGFKVSFKGPLEHKKVFRCLKQYHLFILPTLGENFGHAVFEALSTGRPVLISDQTPWRNLRQHKAGADIPLTDPLAFRKKLEQFLVMDEKEYNEWSAGAHAFARNFLADFDFFEKYRRLFS